MSQRFVVVGISVEVDVLVPKIIYFWETARRSNFMMSREGNTQHMVFKIGSRITTRGFKLWLVNNSNLSN